MVYSRPLTPRPKGDLYVISDLYGQFLRTNLLVAGREDEIALFFGEYQVELLACDPFDLGIAF